MSTNDKLQRGFWKKHIVDRSCELRNYLCSVYASLQILHKPDVDYFMIGYFMNDYCMNDSKMFRTGQISVCYKHRKGKTYIKLLYAGPVGMMARCCGDVCNRTGTTNISLNIDVYKRIVTAYTIDVEKCDGKHDEIERKVGKLPDTFVFDDIIYNAVWETRKISMKKRWTAHAFPPNYLISFVPTSEMISNVFRTKLLVKPIWNILNGVSLKIHLGNRENILISTKY